jgi:eukaryotic-like serine/threonine-protein kinase
MNPISSRKIPRAVPSTTVAAEVALDDPSPKGQTPQPPAYNPYLAGEVIGDRYRLVRELGRGGMGVVWVAHSLVLGVDVALKLLRANLAGPGVSSRMAREAHAAARLGHPALVRVFDFGWTGRGDPYLVMELILGETVSALLARETRVDAIRAVQMILPIADGLRVAHDKHIVHRDIKPDNIFLATDTLGRTQPKLLDFGIAKIDVTPHDGKLTQVGAVLGSPEYMSPEQAIGVDDIDERTDVWSLAIVLYELVTGTVPFTRSNYNALMQAIIHEKPVPMPEHEGGDASLWVVLEKGLAKDREQRWANMAEFGEALALWLYDHGIKEDLSGNSIRAVWLDGPLSGIRTDARSSVPPRRAQNEETENKYVPRANRPTQVSVRLAQRAGLRSHRYIIVMAIAILALAATAVTLLLMLLGRPKKPNPSASVSTAAPFPTAVAQPDHLTQPPVLSSASIPTGSNAAASDASESKRSTAKKFTKRVTKHSSHDFGF